VKLIIVGDVSVPLVHSGSEIGVRMSVEEERATEQVQLVSSKHQRFQYTFEATVAKLRASQATSSGADLLGLLTLPFQS